MKSPATPAMKLFGLHPARLAGWIFLAGNLSLLALGGWQSDWSKLAASFLWIAGSTILGRAGHKPRWFAFACMTSCIAIVFTNYDQLRLIDWNGLLFSGRSPAIATLIGTVLFCIGNGCFGVFSQPLARCFHDAPSPVLRWTLGRPMLLVGGLSALSLIPVLHDAVLAGNALFSAIIASYLVGEALIALSSTDA